MIVDCAAYIDGKRATGTISFAEAREWMDKPGAFVWVGLRKPDHAELAELCECLGLDDLDVDETIAVHTRPVLSVVAGLTWLVLRTARYNDESEEVRLGELSVLFNHRLVITVRYGQASALGGVRAELESEGELLARGPAAVVAAIVDRVVDDYRPALDGFEKDVIEVEREVFSDDRHRPVSRLYHLKRQVLDLYMVTDSLFDPLARLLRTSRLMRDPEVAADMQESLDQLRRVVARTRLLSDLIDTAVNANLTEVSLQQNEDMRRISAWVAIAAVPTAVAGIYGMNFEHMPELQSEYGYFVILGVMAIVCFTLYRTFRKTGWL